jgi:hypothetical protein
VQRRRKGRQTCRTIRQTGLRAKPATFRPSSASRAAVRKARLRAVLADPRVKAHVARVTQHGYQDNVVPAVGRFYFQGSKGSNPLRAWCSGTLILRGVVLTAAHCLYQNTWDTRVTGKPDAFPVGYFNIRQLSFVPGHTVNAQGGPASNYGEWAVADAYVPDGYRADEDANDWGLVLLAPDAAGGYPGDRTGTFAAYGGVYLGQNAPLVKMGYPASENFSRAEYWYGSRQYYCSVSWLGRRALAGGTFSPNGWYMRADGCPMTGGSSGGPVFARFADGTYGIIGVNNRGDSSGGFGTLSYNLWFDQRAIDFFNQVIAYWGRRVS